MKIASAFLLLAAFAVASCGGDKTAEDPIRPVVTMVIEPGAAATRDVYSGELRARYESDLAFRVGGKLVARAVDAGARVKRGQVLARLDPQDARLAAGAAAAQVAAAQSDLALAKAELDRYADLLAKKFISASAFDAKQNAFNAARSRADQARAQAAINDNQAAYTTLAADFDGVIVSTLAEPGQVVAAGQPVMRLARAGEKEILINAPEAQVTRFKPGQDALVSLWAQPASPFRGRVREIAGGADPVTRTYAVRVAAIDPPETAQLGMTANVLFPGAGDASLVLLPLTAIAGLENAPSVWVVDPKTSQVQSRRVSVGQFREDGVTITAGLVRGDIVVTAGAHKLRPAQRVRIAQR
jgi:membrane fusion protein, multidrug efflux system